MLAHEATAPQAFVSASEEERKALSLARGREERVAREATGTQADAAHASYLKQGYLHMREEYCAWHTKPVSASKSTKSARDAADVEPCIRCAHPERCNTLHAAMCLCTLPCGSPWINYGSARLSRR